MLRTLEEKIDPNHTALIVVDVQNDFCHDDCQIARLGGNMSYAQAAVPRIVQLIEAARQVGALVVFLQAVHTEITESEVWREQWTRSRPGGGPICPEGSWGAEFYVVQPLPGEPVVKKHRYSGFINTDLDLILRSRGIKTLIMTGIATAGCVESTARDGFMLDYYIVFTSDATATYDLEEHRSTLKTINRIIGVVCDSHEILDIWSRVAAPVGAD
jgi:ureidoacrylate peracid hydrolase